MYAFGSESMLTSDVRPLARLRPGVGAHDVGNLLHRAASSHLHPQNSAPSSFSIGTMVCGTLSLVGISQRYRKALARKRAADETECGEGPRKFELRDLGPKGIGVVATDDIRQGELIWSDPPLVVFPSPGPLEPHVVWSYRIAGLVEECDEACTRDFWALTDVHASDGAAKSVGGIALTNSIPRLVGFEEELVVYAMASRMNHSCDPNVFPIARPDCLSLRAIRDIAQDEELCISYIDLFDRASSRQSKLQKRFRFGCTCVACSGNGQKIAFSDERRARLAKLRDEFGGRKTKAAIEMGVKDMLSLIEEEFEVNAPTTCEVYGYASTMAAEVGLEELAKSYASKALQICLLFEGYDSPRSRMFWAQAGKPNLDGVVKTLLEPPNSCIV